MVIYFVSGLGADEKTLEMLQLPAGYEFKHIAWKEPLKQESLQDYAFRMAQVVDTTKPFILMGLSFGGIMVQEMNRYIHPEKTILISTVESRQELPILMRFSAKTNFHKLIPVTFFTSDSILSYVFFRNIYFRKKKRLDLNLFFTVREPNYLQWAIHQVVNWKSDLKVDNLYHIHGDDDIVFPHRLLKGNVFIIHKGNHLMIYQKGKAVSQKLKEILEK